MMKRLAGLDGAAFDALSFDVYGTVLDWEPEVTAFLDHWLDRVKSPRRGTDLLARYDEIRQPLQRVRPALLYPEVLRRTLADLADGLGLPVTPGELEAFGGLAATHRSFPDSAGALSRLRAAGFRLAALSNIDERSFECAMAAAGIGFDVVVTAERVGSYKPDHAHFRAALADLADLGIPKSRLLHVAQSLRADIVPARALGLTSVWVNRPGHVFGRSGEGAETAEPDFETDSLAALADHLAASRG
jgi:2-haloacid dehalogenase